MNASFDFHLHSQWSYDALTPVEEYFKFARAKKLRAFALTDHHTMDGYGNMLECAARYPDVRFAAGAELTVHCPLGIFDLVCLNLPYREEGELADLFRTYHEWQVAHGKVISEQMTAMGVPFDDEKRMNLLQQYRPAYIIAKQGNTHVGYGFMQKYALSHGFPGGEKDFEKFFLSLEDLPNFPDYSYVVPIVKRAGGIIFIAHPYNYFEHDNVRRMDELCEMFMLDGIECSNGVPEEYCRFYREYCVKHHLLSSAGTDLHGPDYDRFASHYGEDRWLDEILERVTLH